MIAITFALPAESSAFLRLIRENIRRTHNGVATICGKIDNREIEVLHTGVGENICRQRVAGLLQDRKFDYLISAGFAGALTEQLRVGDLFVARNFTTMKITFPGCVTDLYTATQMIDTTDERRKIAQTTGAAAVDMETKFIAQACAEHGLPMLSLRAISDSLTQPFPAPSNILFDTAGQRTDFVKLAAFFLLHPNRIPRLIQFAGRINRAREKLANALVDIVRGTSF